MTARGLSRSIPLLPLLLAAILVSEGRAAGTRRWTCETMAAFEKGELEGVTLSARGRLRVGRARQVVDAPGKVIWDMVLAPDGRLWIATGDMAEVHRHVPDDPKRPFERMARVDDVAVSCLAFHRGRPVFGTIADGRVYEIVDGKTELLVSLPTPYVWDLHVRDDRLFAATGPDGRIWELPPGAEPKVHCETGQLHALRMIDDPRGGLVVGTSQDGVLMHVDDGGTVSVIHDFEDGEITAMVARGDEIWVAVNRLKGRRREATGATAQNMAEFDRVGAELLDRFGGERGAAALRARAQGGPRQDFLPGGSKDRLGGGRVYRLHRAGRVDLVFDGKEDHVLDLARGEDGLLWIATGPRGRVFTVDDEGERVIRFDLDREQVMRILLRGVAPWRLATGNGAALVLVEDRPQDDAVYRGSVYDAGHLARWGRVRWGAEGSVQLALRSGRTAEPDDTWSPWSPLAGDGECEAPCPPGRYLQLRLRWPAGDRQGSLSRFEIHFRCANQRPRVGALDLVLPGEDDAVPEGDDADGADGGTKKEAGDLVERIRKEIAPVVGEPPAPRPSKKGARGAVRPGSMRVTWKGGDPDGDTLVYRLSVQGEGEEGWIPLTREDEPLDAPSWTGSTEGLADGRYRLRVEASDEEVNGADEALRHARVSEPFVVDNTRPRLRIDAVDPVTGEARGRVFDELGTIRRLRYSLDGGRWRVLLPEDGLFDGREELFRFVVEGWGPGAHVLAVKGWDESGNVGVARKAVRGTR